jgi:hypothetical protein
MITKMFHSGYVLTLMSNMGDGMHIGGVGSGPEASSDTCGGCQTYAPIHLYKIYYEITHTRITYYNSSLLNIYL